MRIQRPTDDQEQICCMPKKRFNNCYSLFVSEIIHVHLAVGNYGFGANVKASGQVSTNFSIAVCGVLCHQRLYVVAFRQVHHCLSMWEFGLCLNQISDVNFTSHVRRPKIFQMLFSRVFFLLRSVRVLATAPIFGIKEFFPGQPCVHAQRHMSMGFAPYHKSWKQIPTHVKPESRGRGISRLFFSNAHDDDPRLGPYPSATSHCHAHVVRFSSFVKISPSSLCYSHFFGNHFNTSGHHVHSFFFPMNKSETSAKMQAPTTSAPMTARTFHGTEISLTVIQFSQSTALITTPPPLLPFSFLLPSQNPLTAFHGSVLLAVSIVIFEIPSGPKFAIFSVSWMRSLWMYFT